jgi:uncharacterized repeat protein (TIGR03987 family)
MVLYAVIGISLALLFYTVGVWSEKIQGTLKKWHLVMFWIGFVFDTTGTTLMTKLASDGFQLNFHGVTGLLAIVLMMFHAVWATLVLSKNNESMKRKFHTFSIIVWIIWLIPFVSGAIFAMIK